jgi:hypothetical protein
MQFDMMLQMIPQMYTVVDSDAECTAAGKTMAPK